VGYVKQNFFVRYRAFDSVEQMNLLAEHWLAEEADPRLHGTVREVVIERFARELPALQPLPAVRYDTAYYETRQVSWDCYVEVRGNRYSVPDDLAGHVVTVRIGLDDIFQVYAGEQLVTQHRLQSRAEGWVSLPGHHARLWQDTLQVEQRPLEAYEEATTWKS
jgi:Mu transposase, C-terminal domain